MKRREPGWVDRELLAAYRAGRLAAAFDRLPGGMPTRPRGSDRDGPKGPTERPADDGWHH